ncbi:MAG: S8 family serine peptidase [Myxococcales bacterium]|nr:S8 family serine peptidase [Myxococcales bacterium]
MTLDPIRALGIQVHGAQRNGTYFVSVPEGVQREDLRGVGARALFAMQPLDKISLRLIPRGAARPPNAGRLQVSARFDGSTPAHVFRAAIDAVEGTVLQLDRRRGRATLGLPPTALLALARHDWIWWLDASAPPTVPSVDVARERIGADQVQPPPWGSAPIGSGLTGAGVVVGIWESPAGGNMAAVSTDHPDLVGRVTIGPGQMITPSFHATNVAGVLAGDGTASLANGGGPLQWSGIAPEAQIVSWDDLDSADEMVTSMMLFGTTLTNHSFGPIIMSEPTCTIAGAYGSAAAAYDDIIRSFGIEAFVSSGNNGELVGSVGCAIEVWSEGVLTELPPEVVDAGFGSVTALGAAKNPITVGGRRKSTPGGVAAYSGRGPTTDGRLKPDVVAISGDERSLITMPSTPQDYSADLGVSFAVPQATGAAALLLEHYRQDDPTAVQPPAVYKAVLANTAADVGAPGPDYSNGYGLIEVPRALAAADSFVIVPVHQGDVEPVSLNVDLSEACGLRVMAVWDDPPSMGPSMMQLVNDIDLLVSSGGDDLLPWVLTPGNPTNLANRGVNSRDNVEQVTVENPTGNEVALLAGTSVSVGPQDVVLHWYAVPCDSGEEDGTGAGEHGDGGGAGCSCTSEPMEGGSSSYMIAMLLLVARSQARVRPIRRSAARNTPAITGSLLNRRRRVSARACARAGPPP